MTGALRPWSAIDDYQHRAIDDLFHHDERLALLETGSGKTMIAMTAGEELRLQGHVRCPLVLAPLRVAQITWPGEREEWEHLKDVPMVCWGGPPEDWAPSLWKDSRILWGQRVWIEQRLPKQKDVKKRRVMEARLTYLKIEEGRVNKAVRAAPPAGAWHVTSFENVAWLTELYAPGESPFDLWIIDETGRVARNPKSPRYKALAKHMPKAKMRWGLNATPAPEGCEDLFGQVQVVIGPRLWGKSFYLWRQQHFYPVDYQGYNWRLQHGGFDRLMADLNTVAFRVPAEALSYQKTIRHNQIMVELPPRARALYEQMEKDLAAVDPTMSVIALSQATASMKLRQIAQGYLYETDEKTGQRIVHHLHDEKTEALAELIESMGREPLLVVYEFDQDLENIRKIWKSVPWLGQGVSATQAAENITRWNKRELPVMAVHPLSASHGLNLQHGGHHIAWLALPWSLDAYKQTGDRIDRRGQTHRVFSHHIIARDTKDQDVSDVLVQKDADQTAVIQAIRKI